MLAENLDEVSDAGAWIKQHSQIEDTLYTNPNSIHTQRWLGWFAEQEHEVALIVDAPYRDELSGDGSTSNSSNYIRVCGSQFGG